MCTILGPTGSSLGVLADDGLLRERLGATEGLSWTAWGSGLTEAEEGFWDTVAGEEGLELAARGRFERSLEEAEGGLRGSGVLLGEGCCCDWV